jgi:hypothetical protein
MNATDSLKLMVRNYPGGIDAMALRLGKSRNTLEKELRGDPSHKLGVEDACEISRLCHDAQSPHAKSYVNTVAAGCGGFVELEVRDGMRHDVPGTLSAMIADASRALGVGIEAMRDGVLTDNEFKDMERALNDLTTDLQAIRVAARAANAAGKPAHIRAA